MISAADHFSVASSATMVVFTLRTIQRGDGASDGGLENAAGRALRGAGHRSWRLSWGKLFVRSPRNEASEDPEDVHLGGRAMMSHFWSGSRDDVIGEIFVALTLAAALALLLF